MNTCLQTQNNIAAHDYRKNEEMGCKPRLSWIVKNGHRKAIFSLVLLLTICAAVITHCCLNPYVRFTVSEYAATTKPRMTATTAINITTRSTATTTTATTTIASTDLETTESTTSEPNKNCLTLQDYQYQLSHNNNTAGKPTGDEGNSQPPLLPDNYWNLCELHNYTFSYRINQMDFCSRNSTPVTLVLIILSSPYRDDRRRKIRKSWGRYMQYRNFTIATVFLFGKLKGSDTEANKIRQQQLDAEAELHGDIVQADFVDSYDNLSYKTLMGLDWVNEYCPQAKYVYKFDDDSAWGPQWAFVDYIFKKKPTNSFICMNKLTQDLHVVRGKSKWKTTFTEYPEYTYPVYCNGNVGYGINMHVLKRVLELAQSTRFFWLEDVYVSGIIRSKLGNVSAVSIWHT